jgi:hypothetical protein
MKNLAREIKHLISLSNSEINNQDLFFQETTLDENSATNELSSSSSTITDMHSLKNGIAEWKKKDEQARILKRAIDKYILMHLMEFLSLYEHVKKHKNEIQQEIRYQPKKRDTSGWINLFLADNLNYSVRQISRYFVAAKRLKDLYNQGISFDIIISSNCFLSDFWCTQKNYNAFLEEFGEISLTNIFINNDASPQVYFNRIIDNINSIQNNNE